MREINNKTSSDGKPARAEAVGILKTACCIFTALIFVIYAAVSLTLGNSVFTTNILNTAGLFAMSLAASLCTLLYKSRLSFAAAHAISFIVIGVIFYILTVVFPGKGGNFGRTVTALAIYVVLFGAATVLIVVLRHKKKPSADDAKTDYKSRF
ncbi:MAG: hypothetical protein IJT70_01625 [Clostridia bacterium]|nr:hypothetical protein [Clostridia bacterium]